LYDTCHQSNRDYSALLRGYIGTLAIKGMILWWNRKTIRTYFGGVVAIAAVESRRVTISRLLNAGVRISNCDGFRSM
jgi:hypothetical protein